MAKPKKKAAKKQRYLYVRALVDCGSLRWEYKVEGASVEGRMAHDEDVSEWSESDIRKLTKQMLNVGDDCDIEVLYM